MFKRIEKKGEPVEQKKFIHGFEEPTLEEQNEKLKKQLKKMKMKLKKQDSTAYDKINLNQSGKKILKN